MFRSSLARAPSRERERLRSHLLLQKGDADAEMTVTWVDVEPGGRQRPHSHDPQQVYVIVAGRGRMQVGDEEMEVGAGELVLIPSGVEHGIVNVGDERLTYVSAATPAFDLEAVYDRGQLAESDP
jgi:mannose-6-phosphate isomerase-like protein (cupin superfamily)